MNSGGRTDITYDLACEIRFETRLISCPSGVKYLPAKSGLKGTYVMLSSLLPHRQYQFTVVAKNGVSHLADQSPAAKSIKEVTTEESSK